MKSQLFDVLVGAKNGKAVYRKVVKGANFTFRNGQVSFTKDGNKVDYELISEEEAVALGAKRPPQELLGIAQSVANFGDCSTLSVSNTANVFNFD